MKEYETARVLEHGERADTWVSWGRAGDAELFCCMEVWGLLGLVSGDAVRGWNGMMLGWVV
jgi:hypothetical protein